MGCGGDGKKTPSGPQCSNGIDDDGDGQIDFPDDLGCANAQDDSEDSAPLPQCSDNRDNDGDGKIDYPSDPGCVVPQQDTETDDCPDGPACPQCGNGKDDDNNGLIDYPADPGCTSAGDADEYTENPVACGSGIMIHQVPATGMLTGTLDAGVKFAQVSPCGGGDSAGIVAAAYELRVYTPKVIVASAVGSATDVVLDLRGAMCDSALSELACTTDASASVTQAVQPGTYYLLVESKTNSAAAFTVNIQEFAGEGQACTDVSECGPGLVCRVPQGGTTMSCQKPVCSDGVDDDGDGKLDYPDDPGCTSGSDSDETDDCPTGPNCPQCANGTDDDNDGQADYPNDTSCTSASGTSEASCPSDMDNFGSITGPTTMGTLANGHKDLTFTCSASHTGNDASYILQLPVALSSLTVDTEGSPVSDTQVEVWSGPCSTALTCDDDSGTGNLSLATVTNLAAGAYAISVGAYSSSSNGAFTLNVHGAIAEGQSCEQDLGGALACEAGTTCSGTAGSRTCAPVACRDGIDNDGDGKMDYPDDPGCTSPNDADETDDCPSGPNCPQCSNGIDDDGDGLTDYPADTSCASAGGTSEASCPNDMDNAGSITGPTSMGTLANGHKDLTMTCSLSHSGNDASFILPLPVPVSSLTIDTEGSSVSDTQVELWSGTCATALGCDDDSGSGSLSLLQSGPLAAGTYAITVAAYSSTSNGAFTLNVHGAIAQGASCEQDLGGALTCEVGTSCSGTMGSRRCMPAACRDGIDNDGDGKIDYPDDPGCTDISDDDETDPATAPVCSNGTDDDADGATDYPADLGCQAASGTSEVFCAPEMDPTVAITAPATQLDTTNATKDVTFSCGSAGKSLTFGLRLAVPVASLTVDTEGSTITDTVVEVSDVTCGTHLACDDDGGTGALSSTTLNNVAPGVYALTVTGYGSSHDGPAQLNVHGTLAAGTRCDGPLVTAGVLACEAGLSCTGTPATCQ